MFIAHIRELDGEEQLLKNHLKNSAKLSGHWGKKFNLEKTCYLAGLLHDFGKYSDEFQYYLRQAVKDPNSVNRGSVDHSTAGGKLLFEYLHQEEVNPFQLFLAEIIGDAIISHHSSNGLQDFYKPDDMRSVYLERVVEKTIPEYDLMKERFFKEVKSEAEFQSDLRVANKEIEQFHQNIKTEHAYFFLLKFVYSCLLDADRTNTMLFEAHREEESVEVDTHTLLKNYQQHLEKHIEELKKSVPKTAINQLRTEMSETCKRFAGHPTGIYSLSIPTGGGKTLASLRFALNHALQHSKDRIIFVVPFTTIIEQNAQVVRNILEDDQHILEHHSNVFTEERVDQEDESESLEQTQELMKDNWDSPIIFTTMVQFLNVISSRGTRNPRRFHNLQNAVIIFDEAQGVPIKCTHMFTESLNYLKNHGQTTSVLCTATQPSLDKLPKELEKDGEMIQNLSEIEKSFKRVDLVGKLKNGAWSLNELADFGQEILEEKNSLLMILNTKSAVLKMYQELKERSLSNVKIFHLSTAMCPVHRKDILKELRKQLKNTKKDQKILCITTQLIEAGVDISFESVIRSTAGLDSMAQAAGRCNRNGEAGKQAVYLVNVSSELEKLSRLKEISVGKEVTERMIKDNNEQPRLYDGELLSAKAQTSYFERYYNHEKIENELVYPVKKSSLTLFSLLGNQKNASQQYLDKHRKKLGLVLGSSPQTIGHHFEVIEDFTTSVIVPYKKDNAQGARIIEDLNGELSPNEVVPLIKEAQQYMVNLFDYEITELNKNGAIFPLYNGNIFALTENSYSNEFGTDPTALAASDELIF
ncbi:CRISPR-associated helicase cas3 [Enterococcus haemoperoxidus ATCC BAA-382]|uniref:CRISPR-associated helicase cas3 n=1 Tax=Enterococcus haemoperoxidus ATCC BAA-382 TaxID=1158608 RepID=R2SSG6_9ENTE|nr:CRISPR-associated helicase/endonuclease Cas3 [Enterococcus haemoperoxidus]EOH98200.1 CRISPR-associated helicase cas3 [Enterococcus haemoperoxidus ATCC BAA-382]EOT59713.1 CRISPR-associated helicase cas3 [Enterococcus haemoperoxidus ATCC BAA-382]